MKIPLAEHFHSIQGEGQWVGTPMHFVRLPGCSVGRHIVPGWSEVQTPERPPLLPTGKPAWLCHSFNSTPFWCDTDFGKYKEMEGEELLDQTWENHICLTGGEPLIHKEVVNFFRTQCQIHEKQLHIETSGTIDFWWEAERREVYDPSREWITVSPKQRWTPYMVHHADELKLLISAAHDMYTTVDPAFLSHPNVYLSPINRVGSTHGAEEIDQQSLALCQEILRHFPHWKLSVQLHKYLGVR